MHQQIIKKEENIFTNNLSPLPTYLLIKMNFDRIKIIVITNPQACYEFGDIRARHLSNLNKTSECCKRFLLFLCCTAFVTFLNDRPGNDKWESRRWWRRLQKNMLLLWRGRINDIVISWYETYTYMYVICGIGEGFTFRSHFYQVCLRFNIKRVNSNISKRNVDKFVFTLS